MLFMQVNNWVLYTRAVGRKKQVEDSIDIFLERLCSLILMLSIEENNTFAPAFWDILILPLLGICKVIIFIKNISNIDSIELPVPTLNNSDTTTGNVSKALHKISGNNIIWETRNLPGETP